MKKRYMNLTMSKKILAILIAFFATVSLWGQTSNDDLVLLDEKIYDFGEILSGTEVVTYFRFKNESTDNVIITEVKPSSQSFKAIALEKIIKPGQIGRIEVNCTNIAKTHVGPFSRTVGITTNLGSRYGIIIKGKIIEASDVQWKTKYDDVGNSFKEGLVWVKLNSKWGFANAKGDVIIPLKYDEVGDFNMGVAKVKLNGKCGFINKIGDVVIPLKYDDAGSFHVGDEFVNVKSNNKWGFINKTGILIIPFKYDEVSAYYISTNAFEAKLNGKTIYVQNGKELNKNETKELEDFLYGDW